MRSPAFFRGEWIESGAPTYEPARRIYNQRIDPRPEVIARCAGVSDVVAALAHARERGLPVNVRSTGTNLGGLSQDHDGLVIDLSPMRAVQILPERRIARIQGGVCSGDLQIEAARHGLGAAAGGLSLTGVGLMLGGGIGHLAARAGYASDNILSVEMVTASGEVVTASPDDNSDLFWAVRGSTGNFGIVTSLEVRLHELPPLVHAGAMSWSLDRLEAPIHALRNWDWASDNLNILSQFGSASLDGRGAMDFYVCHCGPADEALDDIERLRSFGAPDEEDVRAMPFLELTFLLDEAYPRSRTTLDEQRVAALGDELVEALAEKIREPSGTGARSIEILARRGALGRAAEFPSVLRETAEDPTWMIVPAIWWQDESEDAGQIRWVEEVLEITRAIGPVVGGQHPNTVAGPLDLVGVRRMYGDRFDRLRRLKREWDPDNVFAGNHNIPPADSEVFANPTQFR